MGGGCWVGDARETIRHSVRACPIEVVQQTPNLGDRDLAGIFQRCQDYAPYTFQTPATFHPDSAPSACMVVLVFGDLRWLRLFNSLDLPHRFLAVSILRSPIRTVPVCTPPQNPSRGQSPQDNLRSSSNPSMILRSRLPRWLSQIRRVFFHPTPHQPSRFFHFSPLQPRFSS